MNDSSEIYTQPSAGPFTTQWTDIQLLANHGRRMVYSAKRYGRLFVLKTYRNGTSNDRARIQKEFDLGLALDHPNIVHTLYLESIEGVGDCIVLEYIDGMSLADFLQIRPDRVTRYKLFMQLLDAVQYIHSKQIVHRDLKPSNILVTRNGHHIKLIDFGLSDADDFVPSGEVAGTAGYISPEQLAGQPLDCRSDIYSLGKLLYALQLPYKSIARVCTREDIGQRYADCEAIRQAIQHRDNLHRWWPMAIGVICLVLSLAMSGWLYFKPDPRQQIILQAQQMVEEQKDAILAQVSDTSPRGINMALLHFYEICAVKRDSIANTIEDPTLRNDFINASVVHSGKIAQQIKDSINAM